MPYLSLHQPGYPCLPPPGDSLRPRCILIHDPPKLFPVAFPHKQLLLAHASDFPNISQTGNIWPQHDTSLPLSGSNPALETGHLASQCGLSWDLQAQHKQQPSADHFVAQAGWSREGHRQQLTLACTSWEDSETVNLVDSFRFC